MKTLFLVSRSLLMASLLGLVAAGCASQSGGHQHGTASGSGHSGHAMDCCAKGTCCKDMACCKPKADQAQAACCQDKKDSCCAKMGGECCKKS
ncbi:MAG: hypothetical protein JNL10_09405 [Verrucomicrobiales bacterium]|nr:hypothetical protein [Verrucomicrobiales bacterium]